MDPPVLLYRFPLHTGAALHSPLFPGPPIDESPLEQERGDEREEIREEEGESLRGQGEDIWGGCVSGDLFCSVGRCPSSWRKTAG